MTLKYLIQKEFLQIRRNAFLPKLIVMFPSAQTHCHVPNCHHVRDAVGDADGSEEHRGGCG